MCVLLLVLALAGVVHAEDCVRATGDNGMPVPCCETDVAEGALNGVPLACRCSGGEWLCRQDMHLLPTSTTSTSTSTTLPGGE